MGKRFLLPLCVCTFFFPLLLPVYSTPAWEGTRQGGFTASVTLSPTPLTLSDQLTITIEASSPKNYQLNSLRIDQILAATTNNLLLKGKQERIKERDNTLQTRLQYTFEPWQTKTIELPPLLILFEPTDTPLNPTIEMLSTQLSIPIAKTMPLPPPPVTTAHTFKHSASIPTPIQTKSAKTILLERKHLLLQYTTAAGLAVILTTLALLLRRLTRCRKEKTVPTINPLTEAQQKLLQLKNEAEQNGATPIDGFYTTLSNIIKTYIEKSENPSAKTATTEELLTIIKKSTFFTKRKRKLLSYLLQEIDHAKYAAHPPSQYACITAINTTQQLIDTLPSDVQCQ
ncbi:hypothetical protein JYU14_01080 [Simkania negevensis]|uniref:Protein BatD n=1 Tax=Simkania negevensis TaxID=83561 RepID=A0ABS3AQQ3_9BACT|nr:hypothetical protein [Simkania negevensis]